MKTKLLFLLTFACIKLSFGQTYHPLVDSNLKEWKSFVYLYDSNPPDYNTFGISYIRSDTNVVINTNSYKRYIEEYYAHFSNDGWQTPYFTIKYLREDSLKKVYRYGDNTCFSCQVDTNYEYLLYDFSLNVNDTFVSTYCMSCGLGSIMPATFNWKVTNIDSVLVGNSMRKRFFLQEIGYSNTDIWIEGIGDVVHGLFFPSCPHVQSYRYQLVSSCENGSLLFNNPNPTHTIDSSSIVYFSSNCTFSLNIYNQQLEESKVFISNKILYLYFSDKKNYTICLYNILGRCVLIQPIQENMQIDLKSKGINDELLFYRVSNGTQQIKTGKLINL